MVNSLRGWSLSRQSGYGAFSSFNYFLFGIALAHHTWILTLFPGINHLVSGNLDDVAIRELVGESPLISLESRYAILNSSHLLICVVTQRSRGISRLGRSIESVRCRSAM